MRLAALYSGEGIHGSIDQTRGSLETPQGGGSAADGMGELCWFQGLPQGGKVGGTPGEVIDASADQTRVLIESP